MANTPFTNLQKQVESQVSKSPTYYGRTSPSSSDIALQRKLTSVSNKVAQAESDKAKQKWYNTDLAGDVNNNVAPKEPSQGVFKRAIEGLSMPLYGIVGATEAVLGKGSKSGLSNIVENIKEKETFGDLLRKYGVNNAVATAGGFGLDVLLDPVNWATLGTSALIPRIAEGAAKAGAEGALTGLKTGLLGKGLKVLKPITKVIPSDKLATKYGELFNTLANQRELYDKLIQKDVGKMLETPGILKGLGTRISEEIGQTSQGKAVKNFYDKYLNYSPNDWYQKKKAQSELLDMKNALASGSQDVLDQTMQKFKESGSLSPEFEASISKLQSAGFNMDDTVKRAAQAVIDDGAELATTNYKLGRILDADDRLRALRDEAINDMTLKAATGLVKKTGLSEAEAREFLKTGKAVQSGDTGMQAFDAFMTKLSEKTLAGGRIKVGDVIDGYKTFINVFKTAKIGGNPASYVMSAVGNAVMAGMYGLKFWNPSFIKSVKAAKELIGNKPGMQTIKNLIMDPKWEEFRTKYPDVFRSVFGVDPDRIVSKQLMNTAIEDYYQSQLGRAITAAERDNILTKLQPEMEKSIGEILGASGKEGFSPYQSMLKEGATDTTMISAELNDRGMTRILKFVDENKDKSIAYKALNWYFTKPMQAYESIDQSYKLGTAMHLVSNGITEEELKVIARYSPGMELGKDVFFDKASQVYKMSPDRATQIAQDIFMNYSAMPSAVKVLRSIPFFGMPFASFALAMMKKTIQGMEYNPAFYNKVQFLLSEINGGRSPLERKALEGNYYNWYTKAGMVSLPWFRENPVYLNAASYLPYYTMNIFEPTDRNYEKNLGGQASQLLDASPFFKDPAGQIMMNYFIMPHLLQQSDPEGMFGQPLWPSDSTAAAKVGYAMRDMAESVMPSFVAGAGLVTPESMLDYVPSYRWRQIGYAERGKTPIGAASKESKVSRTARAILSTYGGINLYPMQLQYSNTNQ